MPLYDYKCSSCEHIFEKNVRMSEMTEKQNCPECQQQTGEKFIGGDLCVYTPTYSTAFQLLPFLNSPAQFH